MREVGSELRPPRHAGDPHRRAFGLGVSAALAGAGFAHASPGLRPNGEASRIVHPEDEYQPPADLAALRDLCGRMTVPVTLNGAPATFVVDSGANQSALSVELATSLGLEIGPPQLLHGSAGSSMTPTVRIDLMGVGDRRERNVVLSALPRASLGCDGLLGVDRLEGRQLELDFHAGRMRIGEAGALRRRQGEVVMTTHRRDGQLCLVDADAGGVRTTAFIDSGAQTTIGNLALKERRMTMAPRTRWFEAAVVSVTGQSVLGEASVLPDLSFGGFSFHELAVVYADLHTFSLWSLTRTPALLIGMDVLSRFSRVTLDYAHQEARFRAPSLA